MMANEEDYENVDFSDYDDFYSEYEKGKAVIDPNIGSNSDPLLKINLSHPSKIPPPRPTPPPTIDSNLQPQRLIIELDPFHVPKWLSETQISEEERYECSLYGEMLLDRYNQVKGTDFEFVRLVKMMESFAAGLITEIQFKAKSSAAADCTLKTFEGFVFKYWNFRHRVWPLSCRLLRLDPPSYVYDEESRRPVCTYEVAGHPCLP